MANVADQSANFSGGIHMNPVTLANLVNQQMHMQSANPNPNLNEVMNLDPVDGRDTRGRGASRDASNSRIVVQGSNNAGFANQLRAMMPMRAST